MFIGDGPGETDEEEGRPFVGQTGEVLRAVLQKYRFEHHYITNLVSCRPCTPLLDDAGLPRFRKGRYGAAIPLLRDETPTPEQQLACSARLYEEIYLVDPVIIVALGAAAAEFLLKKPVAISRQRGKAAQCTIPGRVHQAVLTEKKQVWERRVNGVTVRPTRLNEVRYTVLPTLHPAYVLRKISDHGTDSPWSLFASDIKKAIQVHDLVRDNNTEERENSNDSESITS